MKYLLPLLDKRNKLNHNTTKAFFRKYFRLRKKYKYIATPQNYLTYIKHYYLQY